MATEWGKLNTEVENKKNRAYYLKKKCVSFVELESRN